MTKEQLAEALKRAKEIHNGNESNMFGQRAYREQKALLEQLSAEYRIRGWAGLIVLLMIVAAFAIAYFALPIR